MSAAPRLAFVEFLTARTWLASVAPWLAADPHRPRRVFAVEASRLGLAVARATGARLGVSVEPLRFRLIDVRDDDGLLARLKVAYDGLTRAQHAVAAEPLFRETVEAAPDMARLGLYLGKALTTTGLSERGTLWRILLTLEACAWTARREGAASAVCFLDRQPWWRAIAEHAAGLGLQAIPVPVGVQPATWWRRRLPVRTIAWGRYVRDAWRLRARAATPSAASAADGPRIATDYRGHLNLDHPERYSDAFFWQQGPLAGRDVLLLFKLREDPLDAAKAAELAALGLGAVGLTPESVTDPGSPVCLPRPRRGRRAPAIHGGSPEARWLREHAGRYATLREAWADVFAAQRVHVFVTWFKYDASHCVIADALRQLGGATAIYQRAFESHPTIETAVSADVVFGFSPLSAELDRQARSTVPYYVTTGYLGDHRFARLRAPAQATRQALAQRGARFVIAFSDENSHDDERWQLGHVITRENYTFLLEQVLREPWFGLVIKPKAPSTLRTRLGPVAALLARAEATGRCVVHEGGVLHGSCPPAMAALAADVMIHGHLCAATAGFEAALAGVPTLLMDREGWPASPLYRLGVGRVGFTDWPSLWRACLERRAGGRPDLGDWSPMLPELDPFRDGRAAERMGTYLHWLLEGYRARLPRETILADAAERYAAVWGAQHVTAINANARDLREPAAAPIPEELAAR
jgi:hypothetical protein